jgi:hypothetical protein
LNNLDLFVMAQLCLAFGMGGLFWPEKFIPLFDILLFPWMATYRAVRVNSMAAIALSVLLLIRLLVQLA